MLGKNFRRRCSVPFQVGFSLLRSWEKTRLCTDSIKPDCSPRFWRRRRRSISAPRYPRLAEIKLAVRSWPPAPALKVRRSPGATANQRSFELRGFSFLRLSLSTKKVIDTKDREDREKEKRGKLRAAKSDGNDARDGSEAARSGTGAYCRYEPTAPASSAETTPGPGRNSRARKFAASLACNDNYS